LDEPPPPPPPFTVRVKVWFAGVPTPLLAVIVREYVPALPDAGVPLSVAVPFPLSLNVKPLGSVPVSVSDGVGDPVVVTLKLPAAPTVNVVLFALVIVGAVVTVKATPLLATPPTVTTTAPVVAPLGTGTVMLVALQPVGEPATPLNVTVLVPCVDPKFVPVIVTTVPTVPEVGHRLVIAGVLVLVLVNVQVWISWVAVSPPVPPVKPTYATLPPTVVGILIGHVYENDPLVVVSIMVMTRFVPSYDMCTWKGSPLCKFTPDPLMSTAGIVGQTPLV
jgi:hypothetical protein